MAATAGALWFAAAEMEDGGMESSGSLKVGRL